MIGLRVEIADKIRNQVVQGVSHRLRLASYSTFGEIQTVDADGRPLPSRGVGRRDPESRESILRIDPQREMPRLSGQVSP
jgi:hypothetical protein